MAEMKGDSQNKIDSIMLKQDVLIIGGGWAGLSAAKILARNGMRVTIVEKAAELGGGCVDWADDSRTEMSSTIAELEKSEKVAIMTGAEVRRLAGQFGSFRVSLRQGANDITELTPAAVLIAGGYETKKEAPGMPAGKGIVFLADLEKMLNSSSGSSLTLNGRPVTAVTFLLDLYNEDVKFDAWAVLRQARVLRTKFKCQVFVLCKDLKVSFASGELLYRQAREAGVLFFKYEASPAVDLAGERLSVEIPDYTVVTKEARETMTLVSDIIALPEVCAPGSDTDRLCRTFGIRRELATGYIMDDNPQFLRVRTNRRGIFIAGACRSPQGLTETQSEAEAAAEEILALLKPGFFTCGPAIAEVDEKKCALCYTCPRLCPHAAITIEKYARQNVYRIPGFEPGAVYAARVEPAACYGCGICVAECPARAISLRGERPLLQARARI